MTAPQLGIFLSEMQGSSSNPVNTGGGVFGSDGGAQFANDFEQAMGQLMGAVNGTASPQEGMTLPSAMNALAGLDLSELNLDMSAIANGGALPDGFLEDLQASLQDYFSQLGNLNSLNEQQLQQAMDDIANQLVDISAQYGITLSPANAQAWVQNLSSSLASNLAPEVQSMLARSQGLNASAQLTTHLDSGLDKQIVGAGLGSSDAPSKPLSAMQLDSLQLLKQTVESQNLSSSSVLDGLKSMMSSTAATSMSASLDDITNMATQASPIQLYSQPQTSAVEEAEVSLQRIPVPPNHRQFSQELGERIMVMTTKSIQTAEIQLTPPELGSLMVKINVESEQASITFSSPHSGVREALEQQSFRLKDMLEEQGVDLVDVDVSDQQRDESHAEEVLADANGNGGNSEEDAESFLENLDQQKSATASMRLVDYYA